MSSPATEEYLELLYRFQAADQPARPADVSRHLGVSSAAVSGMLERLEADGQIRRTADRAVLLTAAGDKIGRSQLRKHRLVERLLHSVIGRPWDAVHAEACRFEHAMSDEVTDSIERVLGNPTTCPHGNPIPSVSDGAPRPMVDDRPLAACRVGQLLAVSRIADEQTELLRYLFSLGLLPGVEIEVEQVAPLGGPLLIRVGAARYAVGRDVAATIFVRQCQPEPAEAEALLAETAEQSAPTGSELVPASMPA